MDDLSHLKRLSAVRTNAGVKFLTPAAFPGNHCPMHTALALSSNIRGMSTLVIGTSECGGYSCNVIARAKEFGDALHWMYVLDANEVVFGCRSGVAEAVRKMDRAGAKSIMLIWTCVPEVIGEDPEGLLHELQPQVGARLCFVQMGHFKCNSYPSGYWKTLRAFADLMEPQAQRPDTINILGRSPEEEHVPLPELLTLLQKRGYNLRMLAPKSGIEDFVAAPDAVLSLVLSPYMNPLAEEMLTRFHVPYISLHEAYSVQAVDGLYAAVGSALGISPADEFSQTRRSAETLERRVSDMLFGTRYLTTHRNALAPLPLALYLAELGMEPLLLHMEEFYPDDKKWAAALLQKGQNPLLCHMVNEKADAPVLERLGAQLSFGEIPESSGKIPCVSYLYELYGQIGYERTALLLTRMLAAFEPTTGGA
ncbi:hypothetical protein SDC9_61258 [bioreactor metagenome]|uniref:Nitrogenase/oxidoreductase component 1 domain-containing protein n=1 Tax=bioreactor metagenome TaxID=1076179 RepID=A0A644XLC5_9ZZZZ